MLPEFRNGAAWNSCLDANADDQDSKPRLPVALSLAWPVWPLRPQDRAMCPFYTDHGVEYTEHDKPAAWGLFPSPARDRGTEQSSGRVQKAVSYPGAEHCSFQSPETDPGTVL